MRQKTKGTKMAMAALGRQLLQRSTPSQNAIRSCASLQTVSYNFPFRSKSLFSTDAPPAAPDVAPINSIADAEQHTSPDPSELGAQDNASPLLKPRVANLPEDLSAEQLEALAKEIDGQDEDVKLKKEEEEEKELAYPTLVKVAQLKKRNPILLADAIREVKVRIKQQLKILVAFDQGLWCLGG